MKIALLYFLLITQLANGQIPVNDPVDLYLHVDKNVYLHNENIWFTAYILNSPEQEQHTLYALLVNDSSKAIVATQRFAISSGLAGGSIFLPDSIAPGNYRLIAYTNSFVANGVKLPYHWPLCIVAPGHRRKKMPAFPQKERGKRIAPIVRVDMQTDATSYRKRSKVTLGVRITDPQHQPVNAFFSMSCVLISRIDSAISEGITDRYRMEGLGYNSAGGMNNVELVKPDTGTILKNGRKLKRPVMLLVTGGRNTAMFATDSAGRFTIPNELLRADHGQQVRVLLPGDKDKGSGYQPLYPTRPNLMDSLLANYKYPLAIFATDEPTQEEIMAQKKMLKAVVVTARKTEEFRAIDVFKSVDCRDWVCMNNILNCENHPTGFKPVHGTRYMYNRGIPVRYESCNLTGPGEKGRFIKNIDPISYPQDYYVADYSKHNPDAPEVLSTIFWSYKVITDNNGEATVSFYTNDIKGRFVCTIQGYSDEGVFIAKTYFKVVE